MEIWGYQAGQSAFSNVKAEAKDHIYGKREGIKNYDVSGSDTHWNTIPCTNSENSGEACWKKIPNSKKILYMIFIILHLKKLINLMKIQKVNIIN